MHWSFINQTYHRYYEFNGDWLTIDVKILGFWLFRVKFIIFYCKNRKLSNFLN